MPLHGHLQCGQQSLRCIKIQDHSLLNLDRFLWNANRLWIEPKIDDQLFGRTCDATEIRIARNGIDVVDLQRTPLRCLLRRGLRRLRKGGTLLMLLATLLGVSRSALLDRIGVTIGWDVAREEGASRWIRLAALLTCMRTCDGCAAAV